MNKTLISETTLPQGTIELYSGGLICFLKGSVVMKQESYDRFSNARLAYVNHIRKALEQHTQLVETAA